MSRLRIYKKEGPSQEAAEIMTPHVAQHHILIEAVPVPVGTNEYDPA